MIHSILTNSVYTVNVKMINPNIKRKFSVTHLYSQGKFSMTVLLTNMKSVNLLFP